MTRRPQEAGCTLRTYFQERLKGELPTVVSVSAARKNGVQLISIKKFPIEHHAA
jgi:hypothetical protein